jgi:predicted nucleotidyltransferase
MRRLRNDGRPIDIDDRLPDLVEKLRPVEGLVAAYLFGSYGTPYQTPLSDVDLALVFRDDAAPDRDGELRLVEDVTTALAEDDVSVVILNRADVILQFRVLETGRPLLVTDPTALADFSARVFSRHADFRIDYDRFLREYDGALVARYGSGAR